MDVKFNYLTRENKRNVHSCIKDHASPVGNLFVVKVA